MRHTAACPRHVRRDARSRQRFRSKAQMLDFNCEFVRNGIRSTPRLRFHPCYTGRMPLRDGAACG